MHPLSVFPQLYSYPFLAYFLLRIAVAFGLFLLASRHWKNNPRWLGVIDAVVGIFTLIGLYTQPALIAAIILFKWDVWTRHFKNKESYLSGDLLFYSVMALIAFCLLFLGPGAFAFDLPL